MDQTVFVPEGLVVSEKAAGKYKSRYAHAAERFKS